MSDVRTLFYRDDVFSFSLKGGACMISKFTSSVANRIKKLLPILDDNE
jgi:hypothetical protein